MIPLYLLLRHSRSTTLLSKIWCLLLLIIWLTQILASTCSLWQLTWKLLHIVRSFLLIFRIYLITSLLLLLILQLRISYVWLQSILILIIVVIVWLIQLVDLLVIVGQSKHHLLGCHLWTYRESWWFAVLRTTLQIIVLLGRTICVQEHLLLLLVQCDSWWIVGCFVQFRCLVTIVCTFYLIWIEIICQSSSWSCLSCIFLQIRLSFIFIQLRTVSSCWYCCCC